MKSPFNNLTALLLLSLSTCQQNQTPEEVLKTYLTYLKNGECEKAVDLEIENSMEIRVIENCEPYESEIKSITCQIRAEAATCTCFESRNEYPELEYHHDLKKVDGEWRLAINR